MRSLSREMRFKREELSAHKTHFLFLGSHDLLQRGNSHDALGGRRWLFRHPARYVRAACLERHAALRGHTVPLRHGHAMWCVGLCGNGGWGVVEGGRGVRRRSCVWGVGWGRHRFMRLPSLPSLPSLSPSSSLSPLSLPPLPSLLSPPLSSLLFPPLSLLFPLLSFLFPLPLPLPLPLPPGQRTAP